MRHPPARAVVRDPIDIYRQSGCIPWSTGYQESKELFIQGTLSDDAVLERFRRAEALPPGYGVGFDERVVEYPWTLARVSPGNGRILDAGGTFNYGFLACHSLLQDKALHILTLVPEGKCQCVHGVSHIYGDLRSVPISSAYYDVIVCISTLEHVGMDNTRFSGAVEHALDDYLLAVGEMRRLLRPGGTLLLTVPFGRSGHFGSFRMFDKGLIANVITAFSPTHVEEAYFQYTGQGWCLSDADACSDAEFVPWIMQSAQERPASFPTQPDNAAAARAVACLKLTT